MMIFQETHIWLARLLERFVILLFHRYIPTKAKHMATLGIAKISLFSLCMKENSVAPSHIGLLNIITITAPCRYSCRR